MSDLSPSIIKSRSHDLHIGKMNTTVQERQRLAAYAGSTRSPMFHTNKRLPPVGPGLRWCRGRIRPSQESTQCIAAHTYARTSPWTSARVPDLALSCNGDEA